MKIKDLPKEIQQLAKQRRKEQNGTKNRLLVGNAFEWYKTPEGKSFWEQINNGYFDVFYKLYPANSIKVDYEIVSAKTDPIVDSVIKQFKDRSEVGIKKYGTTLQDNKLTTLEWINHAQQESMDFCLYLEKLKQDYEQ